MNIEQIALIINSISTVAVVFAAFYAARSAIITKRAAKGQLVSKLYDEYWSYELAKAKRTIRNWVEEHSHDAFLIFGRLFRKSNLTGLNGDELSDFESIDSARRLVKAYYRKVQQLYYGKYLDLTDVVDLLAPSHRAEIVIRKIEGFEAEMNPNYQKEMYEFYSRVHKIDRILVDDSYESSKQKKGFFRKRKRDKALIKSDGS